MSTSISLVMRSGREGGAADSVPELLEAEEDVAQREVVGKQLDLSGAVEYDVVV